MAGTASKIGIRQVAVALGVIGSLATAAAEEQCSDSFIAKAHCTIQGMSFASCADKPRHFRSVVIAIPGWAGKCATTFGQGTRHLLRVMQRKNFFDVDCFDYDSHETSLQTSREQLACRVRNLRAAGYRELTFITHSTGGVLALDYLLTQALKADKKELRTGPDTSLVFKTAADGLRVRGLYTWAVPLNGLRSGVRFLGSAGNMVGLSTAVLPHLKPNSSYLQELKGSLDTFDKGLPGAESDPASSYGFKWFILQGQGEDGVVLNIPVTEPWLPPNMHKSNFAVINTATGHSSNVAVSGAAPDHPGGRPAPGYPAEMMLDKSKLVLGLQPRIGEYFIEGLTPTDNLTAGQRIILRGIVDFAGEPNLFPAARPTVAEFVVTMLQGKFVRAPGFDDEVVAGLRGLLSGRLKELQRPELVAYVDSLSYDIEQLDVKTLGRSDRFGGGSYRAVRRLPDLVSEVLATANDFVRGEPELAGRLQSSGGSLGRFQERVVRVLAMFLEVADDDETRAGAVIALRSAIKDVEPSTVMASGVIPRLGAYAKVQAKLLPPNAKAELAKVFAALAAQTDDVKSAVLAVLNENVEWLQRQQKPIWFTLLSDDQIKALVALPASTSAPLTHLEFLEAVIANGGARGNSPEIAAMAVDAYQRYLAAPAFAGMRPEMRARLRAAMEKTPYPAVAARIERALAAMGS